MPKLEGGVDAVFDGGKVYRHGEEVPARLADEARANGAVFEGDKGGGSVILVSTPQNPIPTDLSGNSALASHKSLVDAKRKQNDVLAEAQADLVEAQAEANASVAAPAVASSAGVPANR